MNLTSRSRAIVAPANIFANLNDHGRAALVQAGSSGRLQVIANNFSGNIVFTSPEMFWARATWQPCGTRY